jgi:hypothetical protein
MKRDIIWLVNYLWLKEWRGLIIEKPTRYYNSITGKNVPMKNLAVYELKNHLGIICMEAVEKHKLWYIVHGMDEEGVAIRNRWNKVGTQWDYSKKIWWAYRIKNTDWGELLNLDFLMQKVYWYTIIPWSSFYWLLCVGMDKWFVMDWDVKEQIFAKKKKKTKRVESKLKLTPWELVIANQAMMYWKRVWFLVENIDIWWPAEDRELNHYQFDKKVDINKSHQIRERLIKDKFGTTEILKEISIWKKTYVEVINAFIIK